MDDDRPLTIANVLPTLSVREGGLPAAVIGMGQAVAARGHRVEIHTTNFDPVERAGHAPPTGDTPDQLGGLSVYRHQATRPRLAKRSPDLARALWRHMATVDVAHIHTPYLHHVFAAHRACRRWGVPYLHQTHGAFDPYIRRRRPLLKRLTRLLYDGPAIRDCAAMVATTEEEARLGAAVTGDRPWTIVELGVDADAYAEGPDRAWLDARWPQIAGKALILNLGRISYLKGLDVLIAAAAQLRDRDDWALVQVGNDDENLTPALTARAQAAGLADRVHFIGPCYGDAKRAWLRNAALFALPSSSDSFGLAVIEAIAAGAPVAISDKVKIWPAIADADAGLVFPIDVDAGPDGVNADAAAAALRAALDAAPERRAAWVENGRRLVRARYAWPAIGARLEAIYRAAIAGNVDAFAAQV